MQARLKAGWITEADLARLRRRGPREAEAVTSPAPSMTSTSAHRADGDRARGGRAPVRRDARSASGSDLIRSRHRTGRRGGAPTSSANCRAAASGSRATRDVLAAMSNAKSLREASSATSGCRPICSTRPGRLHEQSALDALAIAAKAGSVVSGFAKVENALDALPCISAPACRRSRAGWRKKA